MNKILGVAVLLAFCSCRTLNPSVMFKTSEEYPFLAEQTLASKEYKIASNDIIGLSVYTNDGFKLIDLTTNALGGGVGSTQGATFIQYTVDHNGEVKLPIIGQVKLENQTIQDAEKYLEQQYAAYYNKPFVMLKVMNRRVLVFPGSGGAGKVVTLTNENTTLIEALALAGGITETGKAYKIKLIRGDHRNPQVQKIDLSTVEGMRRSNLQLQANDIIYVEPVPRVSQQVLAQITPVIGIITSVLLIYDIVINRQK